MLLDRAQNVGLLSAKTPLSIGLIISSKFFLGAVRWPYKLSLSPIIAATSFLISGCSTLADVSQAPRATLPLHKHVGDGAPNWTGFWIPAGGLLETVLAGETGAQPPPKSLELGSVKSDDPLQFMKSPYKEEYAELLRKEALGEPAFDPTTLCFPPGMPRMMNMTYGMEILQTPGLIAITSEWGPATRRIWLDREGRSPPEDEQEFTYAGFSLGRWEGDELIVETVGLRTDALIDKSGLKHSKEIRLTERFRMVEPGLLLDEITVIDPVIFTAPWKIARYYRYRPDLSLKEYVCQDNNDLMAINAQPPPSPEGQPPE